MVVNLHNLHFGQHKINLSQNWILKKKYQYQYAKKICSKSAESRRMMKIVPKTRTFSQIFVDFLTTWLMDTIYQNDRSDLPFDSHYLHFGQKIIHFGRNWLKKYNKNSADFGCWEQEPKISFLQDFIIVCYFLPHSYQLVFLNASWIFKKKIDNVTDGHHTPN